MATTGAPANLPLLGDGDPVTPIQAPINAIAKALNDWVAAQDTGWITLPLASGVSTVGGTAAQYRRKWGVLWLKGIVTGMASGATIATLPAGFRPDPYTYAVTNSFGGSTTYQLQIKTDGSIVASNSGGSAQVNIAMSVPVAQ